jgi:A/G-specific adenine glycosylase
VHRIPGGIVTTAPWTQPLLEWYLANRRELPWRETTDPYRVWVSEIMLQQTRVDTVVPYYRRFLECFPTIADLANADLDKVLKLWEGLGYYARARNLHRAAQVVLSDFGGVIPNSFCELRKLPGLGEYTAAAVASIACFEAVPVIDGNVLRVVSRLLAITDEIRTRSARIKVRNCLKTAIDREVPGEFNQAMMELGALVCTPRSPNCTECPLNPFCEARKTGRTAKFPVRKPRRAIPHHQVVVGLIRDENGRFLITRRPENVMLGGLWEFPGGKAKKNEALDDALRRELREELSVEVEINGVQKPVEHAYSHFSITLTPFDCVISSGIPQPRSATDMQWVSMEEFARFAFPKTTLKVMKMIHSRPMGSLN